jgi:hypothetical protein
MVGMLATGSLAGAQGSADSMQMVRDQLRADKKLLVSKAMTLTEPESKRFWPVYESYQKEFSAVSDRLAKLIEEYAKSYAGMTNESARKLVNDYFVIEGDRQKIRLAYLPKFRQVLSDIKVARFYQLENKIQATANYELAAGIPLME